jgi:glycosyltransferase involved in cell wall biosynthesis
MEVARLHKFVDRFVVPSKASQSVLKEQGFRNVQVIPHGVSQHLVAYEDNPTLLDSLNLPVGADLVFCPGRADEHKDLPLFIQGAGILNKRIEKRTAFLLTSEMEKEDTIESPEYIKALHVLAQVYGLVEGKDIFFVRPFQYGRDLATVYRCSRVVVVPSLHESFGQNVLDAFMFGKPVVVRARTGLKEIVQHEENGLLFESPKKMAWQVLRALTDDDLVARIAENAKAWVADQYSVDRMARDYRDLYQSVLSG